MKSFKITLVLIVAGASAICALLVHHRGQADWELGERKLQEQSKELAVLTRKQEDLSKLAAQARKTRVDDSAAEVSKLRAELASLRQQTNAIGSPSDANNHSWPRQYAHRTPEPRSPEYYQQLHALAGSKAREARDLGRAFGDYAFDHNGQSPASLDDLKSYLAQNHATLSGTNHFEIIYQGSLSQLDGLPWGSIAAIRDSESWPGPDGKLMRVYGFPGGIGQIVGPDWEPAFLAQHVISAPPTPPSGQ